MSAWMWFVLLAFAWWLVRGAIARHVERRFEAQHPRDGHGVMIGADSIMLEGPRPGAVLLLHGYNDSPQSLASVAAALHARGWSVHAPLLPGHGRTLQQFAASGAEEWIGAGRRHLQAMLATHDEVAVGGLSMGGAIALVLAAKNPEVKAVVDFAPYLHASAPLRFMRIVAPIASIGAKYIVGGGTRSVHDEAAAQRMIAYRMGTPRLLMELDRVVRVARAALPRVRQPVLVIQSREDNRIPVHSAEESFARIGSADKTLHWVTGAGHVVTVDYGHEAIETLAGDWLESRLR